jgi:hypothetical protein
MRTGLMNVVIAAAAAIFLSGCSASDLVCEPGWGDCDGDPGNGCETRLDTLDNCGQCGAVCGGANATGECSAGTCVLQCDPGFGDCDNDPTNGCELALDDIHNCGACYNSCTATNASGECVQGVCEMTCAIGWGDCNNDMLDGCESDLFMDQTCGACDQGCTTFCSGGRCETCDALLLLDSEVALDAAQAMGFCNDVIAARWVQPDGSELPDNVNVPLGWGILDGFGPNVSPRIGDKFLALSSGAARQPTDPGYRSPSGFDKGYTTGFPEGFPKESPSCPGVVSGVPRDGVGVEFELEVPDWAQGLAFDFYFYTFEWPSFICSQYNDFFVALLDPPPPGQSDGNISFDQLGNPVSVNNAFLSVCGCFGGPPCNAGGKTFDCAGGTDELMGTGFEGHAGTGWLTTKAPVEPGSTISIRFAIWDSGDGILDSTVLIDNFRWVAEPPEVSTNPID